MKKTPASFMRQSFQIEGIHIANADKDVTGALIAADGIRKSSFIEEEAIKLPSGDFVISWSPSGFPVITRTPSAKTQCPDRLNLDKQRLSLCPILEGEAHLRLLNYQHNLITKIENLGNLTKLIFLDLYDNQIGAISGLDMLKSLRVLMLGKNKIKRIENLSCLKKLDVLDLHNNQIVKIEGLDQLQELRVLNLAGNQIRKVENLRGLHSLTELNLRRNLIETVKDCEFLSNLKQLYLSYNMIARFEDVANIALCRSLVEIALDGNPLCQGPCYRIATIKQMPQIKQLDLKRITAAALRTLLSAYVCVGCLLQQDLSSAYQSKNPGDRPNSARSTLRTSIYSALMPQHWETNVPIMHTCRPEPAQIFGLSSNALTITSRRPYLTSSATEINFHLSSSVVAPISQEELARLRSDDERQIANAFKIGNPISGPVAMSAHTESNVSGKTWHASDPVSASAPASRESVDAGLVLRQSSTGSLTATATGTALPTSSNGLQSSLSKPTTFKIKIPGGVSITQQLDVYDVESLFKPTHPGVQSPANITTISFNRIDYEDIAPHLGKIRSYYPALTVICFNECNIQTLVQLAQLTNVRRLQQIVVGFVNNPVTTLTYWRPFLAWKTGINSVNGEQVSELELTKMEQIFGLIPSNPPLPQSVNAKVRDYVLKYVRDTREEAIRNVENTSRLRFVQDQLIVDLIRHIGGTDL